MPVELPQIQPASKNRHTDQPMVTAGSDLQDAHGVLLLLHGRGASAEDIIGLADELDVTGLTYLAPQAYNSIWYPNRFLAPIASNQPWLDWALERVGGLAEQAAKAGIPPERMYLLGFSQGASLALEFAARSGRRWGGVFGLSGALIGPPGAHNAYPPGLAGTPVLLGCSDVDPFIPHASVLESAQILSGLGAAVDTRIYPGMGHTIHQDEIIAVRAILERAKVS